VYARLDARVVATGVRVVHTTWYMNGVKFAAGTPGTRAYMYFWRTGTKTVKVVCKGADGRTYTATKKIVVTARSAATASPWNLVGPIPD
jgi:hypothetical protein